MRLKSSGAKDAWTAAQADNSCHGRTGANGGNFTGAKWLNSLLDVSKLPRGRGGLDLCAVNVPFEFLKAFQGECVAHRMLLQGQETTDHPPTLMGSLPFSCWFSWAQISDRNE